MRRVVIEEADPAARDIMAATLEAEGFHVDTCPGPSRDRPCPLVQGDDCDMVQHADVVVCALHLANSQARDVVRVLRLRCPGTPVVIAASSWQASRYSDTVREARVLEHPVKRDSLVAAVRDALTEG
jgi:CheY-like chemotaxis protein